MLRYKIVAFLSNSIRLDRSGLRLKLCLLTAEYAYFELCILRRNWTFLNIVRIFFLTW